MSEVTEAYNLLHDQQERVFADAGYIGAEKRAKLKTILFPPRDAPDYRYSDLPDGDRLQALIAAGKPVMPDFVLQEINKRCWPAPACHGLDSRKTRSSV